MKNNKVTIRQIAKEAGVSVATVSRVFNDREREKVGEKVRNRVQDIIGKYGYVPSISAKGLVCGKTSLVGVQVLTVSDSLIHADLVSSVEEKASEYGYSVILGVSGWNKEKEERSIRVMLEKGVEGIIWVPIGDAPNKSLIKKIQSYNCPFLWLSKDFGCGIPFIGGDNSYGGYITTDYCCGRGHRNIAFVGNMADVHCRLRLEGYKKCLEANKITREFVLETDNRTSPAFYNNIRKIIDENNEISAFVCANDTTALGVYKVLMEKGLKIGKEVTVTGYGNRDYSEYLTPPLTSVSMKSYETGEKAMEALAKLINKEVVENVLVKPKLVIRES